MYEVELKIEITDQEKERLISEFEKKGFTFKGTTPQNDFYIEATESPYGGYNLRRYRHEGEKFIFTEKIWEITNDIRARKENETPRSKLTGYRQECFAHKAYPENQRFSGTLLSGDPRGRAAGYMLR